MGAKIICTIVIVEKIPEEKEPEVSEIAEIPEE